MAVLFVIIEEFSSFVMFSSNNMALSITHSSIQILQKTQKGFCIVTFPSSCHFLDAFTKLQKATSSLI